MCVACAVALDLASYIFSDDVRCIKFFVAWTIADLCLCYVLLVQLDLAWYPKSRRSYFIILQIFFNK